MAYNKVVYAGTTLVDLTGVTVTPETLAEGVTAHNAQGEQIVGTMSGTAGTPGGETVAGVSKVTYGDETIIDLTGDTVAPETLAEGETAIDASGALIVGTMSGEIPVYDNYFAVYSADDSSLTFYGDDTVPSAFSTYKGKLVRSVYTGVEDTGSSNPPWYSNRTSFKSVLFDDSFAKCRPKSLYSWFANFSNCTTIDGLANLDTSGVTDMWCLFQNCTSLTSLDISNFDTSSVTDMYGLFFWCSALTSVDVSNFDTSNVTDMGYMFYRCTGLTSVDVSNFDTSNVTDMGYMFYRCTGLTSLDVSSFNTSSVTNMSQMFYSCSSLTTIYSDDSNFVTTAVTNGSSMFSSCSKLVGGNGTVYSSSHVDATYAHIDTASNPGYFTDINDKPE